MKPQRIQRKRTKGWKMPDNTIYVGRPSIWSNPFKESDGFTREQSVQLFRDLYLNLNSHKITSDIYLHMQRIRDRIHTLSEKNLACWCSPEEQCHADVLLEMSSIFTKNGTTELPW